MSATKLVPSRILVVDPHRDRYRFLEDSPSLGDRVPVYCDRGAEALRIARRERPRWCIAHVTLPDMSGFDFISLLDQIVPLAQFVLVADVYDSDEERRAFLHRRTKYLAPPMDEWWLRKLLLTPAGNARLPLPPWARHFPELSTTSQEDPP